MVGSSKSSCDSSLSSKSKSSFTNAICLMKPGVLKATYAFSIRLHVEGVVICRQCRRSEVKTSQVSSVTDCSETITLESVVRSSFSYLAQLFNSNIDYRSILPKLKVPPNVKLSDPAHKYHDADITLVVDGENYATCPSCIGKSDLPLKPDYGLTSSDISALESISIDFTVPGTLRSSLKDDNSLLVSPLTINHPALNNAEDTEKLISVNVNQIWDISIPHEMAKRVQEILQADANAQKKNKKQLDDRSYALIDNEPNVHNNVCDIALWYYDSTSSDRMVKCLIYKNKDTSTYFIRSKLQFGSIKAMLLYYSKKRLVRKAEDVQNLKGVLLKRLICCCAGRVISRSSSVSRSTKLGCEQ